jgi:hypothetical protein
LCLPLAGLLLLCSTSSAQLVPDRLLPSLQTSKAVKPGTWVRYTIFNRHTRQASLVRIAALEKERKGQWFEIGVTNHKRETAVFKALIKGSLAKPEGVARVVVQPPGLQPVEVPLTKKRKQKIKLPARLGAKPDPRAKLVGRARVKVAAGTFDTQHFRRSEGKGKVVEIWSSTKVPGWPMVKASTPEVVLELVGYGDKAKSQVRGKPGKLDPKLLKQLGLPH